MKRPLFLLLPLFFPLLFAGEQGLDTSSPWEFHVGYALGYTDYSEDGNIFNVRSDWSGLNSVLDFKIQKQLLPLVPYFRLRLINTEEVVEEWRNEEGVFQYNDMHMYGGDASLGFYFPDRAVGLWTFTPQLGLIARVQNFERSDFVNNSDQLGLGDSVSELSQTYGAGGGFVLKRPLSDQWAITFDTEVYGLFFSKVYNDGFEANIQGDSGIFWDSSLGVDRGFLEKPYQSVAIRLTGHLQWIEGGQTGTEADGNLVEWPENRLRNVSLELLWKSQF